MDNKFLLKTLSVHLEKPVFKEVFDIVRKNSTGKIWLIGGFLYKNIISSIYGEINSYEYDIDFVVEHKNENLKEIHGWNIENNSYGHKNYFRRGNKLSIIDINKAIRVSGIKNTSIEGFLNETPLSIQSICYDFHENVIIGDKGINAIRNKIIEINNYPQMEFYAQRKAKSVEDIIKSKANELNFNYKLNF